MSVIKSGKDGNTATVNTQGQLLVRAATETELEDASEEGQAYTWHSLNRDIDVGDTLLLVKNTSETSLHIDTVTLAAGNVATRYTVHLVSADVTVAAGAGGAVVVGVNMNLGSNNVADASAAADEEGNTQGSIIEDVSLLATTSIVLPLAGIILSKNTSIAVDQVTESTSGTATFRGHYEVGE